MELNGVTKVYRAGKTEVAALRGVSFSIAEGEFTSIMGPSGSGKSTLLNILGCLDLPSGGQYILGGQRVDKLGDAQLAELRNRRLGFVFQSFHLLPRLSALQNVELPLVYRGVNGPERHRRAREALSLMGLDGVASRRPSELSGGQQQRVAIARAIVGDPSVILADEPTGNLDSQTGREIMILFQELNANRGMTIILVTHDPAMASYGRRTIVLRDGQIVSDGAPAVVSGNAVPGAPAVAPVPPAAAAAGD